MKNLLIFVSPTKSFNNPRPDLADNDAGQLIKIQIENSFRLGWKKEDIMLVTNFDYQYGDIKAIAINEIEFFDRKPQASKINAIVKMFRLGLIKAKETYWFHDIDTFQQEVIRETEVKIKTNEIAVTDFGGAKKFGGEDRWSGGIFYFKIGSADIFTKIKDLMYQKQIDEEEALGLLVINDPKIRKRVKKINSTYNFIGYNLKNSYKKATKPLKVLHFHPRIGKKGHGFITGLKFFRGENPLKTSLISWQIVKLFKYHKIA